MENIISQSHGKIKKAREKEEKKPQNKNSTLFFFYGDLNTKEFGTSVTLNL